MNLLSNSVSGFASQLSSLPDSSLDHPWAWKTYNTEGIRFACFRTYEELRELAVKLHTERIQAGKTISSAQAILSTYHAAFLDLQASLLERKNDQLIQVPAEGQWSVQKTLAHMLDADMGFYALVRYALSQHRRGVWQPSPVPEQAWPDLIGLDEKAYQEIMEGSVESIQGFYLKFHQRILDDLADMQEGELELPSMYWEAEPMPLRFRLHRFDSHLRQHTIQIEKILLVVAGPPSETRRLVHLIYAALAEVEGGIFGIGSFGETAIQDLATAIQKRTQEIIV